MSRVPLDNSSWGFTSNCFVCEPANGTGLRIPFFHDEESQTVEAEFTLGEEFSGAPSYVHGGISLAILDEAMAWAAIAVGKAFAVTVTTTTNFLRPIRVGRSYKVTARLAERDDEGLQMTATIVDDKDRSCADATARFAHLSADQAKSAVGTEVTDSDADYVRG